MRRRLKTVSAALGALAVLALGGSALATASNSHSSSTPEQASSTDIGPAVQQGDQTTPDAAVTATSKRVVVKHATSNARRAAAAESGADPAGANDTTSPDTGSAASERASETASETGPGDGPGGHADAAGQSGVDFQGEQP